MTSTLMFCHFSLYLLAFLQLLLLSGVTVQISTTTPTQWTTLATPTPTRAPRPVSLLHRWLEVMALVQEVNTMAEAGPWWRIRVVQWVVPTTKSRCLLHLLRPWMGALCHFHQWTTGKHTSQNHRWQYFSPHIQCLRFLIIRNLALFCWGFG